jgi:protein translocase SecG subunit
MVLTFLPYLQIILSIILIGSILLQQSGAGIGALGGSDNFATFHTKRGAEKGLFVTSIVSAILFALASLLAIIL